MIDFKQKHLKYKEKLKHTIKRSIINRCSSNDVQCFKKKCIFKNDLATCRAITQGIHIINLLDV